MRTGVICNEIAHTPVSRASLRETGLKSYIKYMPILSLETKHKSNMD